MTLCMLNSSVSMASGAQPSTIVVLDPLPEEVQQSCPLEN